MTDESPQDPASGVQGLGDRRKPVARYVEFGDDEVQARFIAVAEAAYRRLVAADQTEGVGQLELPGPPPAKRRGLFRQPAPTPGRVIPTTPALSRAAHVAAEVPGVVQSSPYGCTASRRVAQTLGAVTVDLVRDLLELPPAEQAEHPAYRQTLRLASELEGVREIVSQVGCTNPEGCVGIRLPEHWGRRVEDVEVAEVRAVLHQLARAGRDTQE